MRGIRIYRPPKRENELRWIIKFYLYIYILGNGLVGSTVIFGVKSRMVWGLDGNSTLDTRVMLTIR